MARKPMGLHVMHADRDDLVRAYIDRVRPTVVKWLDDPGGNDIVQYARDRGALTVLRVYEADQRLGGDYIGRVVAAMQQWPAFMVGESFNEDFQTPPEASRRAEFDIELMKAMDRIGRKAGILCASTGQPEMSFWPDYLPAIRYAAEHGHYVCWHEYGGGPVGMLWGVGQNQHPWNERVDKPENAAARGWWVLRYRRHVDEWRRLGLTTIPRQYIGEGGLDDIWPRPGHGGKGYKDFIGEHPAGVGDYAEQWAWTCRRWAEDDYMVGGVDFGFASRDPQWSSFDMATDPATLADVQATMAALGGGGPVPVPTPGGDPMSTRLSAMLRAEFGELYDDLRGKLRTNPNGPNGAFGYLDMAKVDGIAVHHTAAPETVTWESTAAYHVDTRKFAGIGYHMGIRQGRVALFDEVTTARAHITNENHHLLGVVFAGNYQSDPLDPTDVALLRRLVKVLDAFLGRQVRVGGHRDFAPPGYTVCPGSALYAQVSGIRAGTDEGLKQALGKWADVAQAQGIQPNPGAALYRAILADHFYPLTDEGGARGEWPELEGYPGVVPQLARSASGNAERVYYWQGGKVHKADR